MPPVAAAAAAAAPGKATPPRVMAIEYEPLVDGMNLQVYVPVRTRATRFNLRFGQGMCERGRRTVRIVDHARAYRPTKPELIKL